MILGNFGGCPAFPKIRGDMSRILYPCYAECKFDGEANLYMDGRLINKSSGRTRTDFPVTQHLSACMSKDTVLFGELYWEDGKFGRLYDLNSHYNDNALKFAVFDCYHPSITHSHYEDRREWLINNMPETPQVHVIPTAYIENHDRLQHAIQHSKVNGFEGIVVKNRGSRLYLNSQLITIQCNWVKIKHKYTDDLRVIYIDPTLERMEVQYKQRKVGVKLIHKYRPLVSVDSYVEIEHQGVLNGGSLRHPVFNGKVKGAGCAHCLGQGLVHTPNGPDDYNREICPTCNGDGYVIIQQKGQAHGK